jgi:hypothetical protein
VAEFIDTCLESYWSAPGVQRMRSEGSSGRWAVDLRRLVDDSRLGPFREMLAELADDGAQTLDPLNRFLDAEAASIPPMFYARASTFGIEQLQSSPGAAYWITLISVLGWATGLGDDLFGQTEGYPDRGWNDMPHAYAQAALKVGDVLGARQVVDTAYETLMAARFHDHPALIEGIASYRTLAGTVARRFEQAVDNLADELLRSDLGTLQLALLWTLGFVPECESLRRTGEAPARPMVRTLIRLSLDRIPHDPLTQYVWLEMKDRPSFDLRGHHNVFCVINRRYHQYPPDDDWPVEPSRAYVETLVRWFDGSLEIDDVAIYLDLMDMVRGFEDIRGQYGGTSDWSVYLRMISLAYLLATEHGLLAGDPQRMMGSWRGLLDQVVRTRSWHHLNPHRADLEGTLNYPLFHVVEHGEDRAEVLHDMERYRAAAMAFPLAAVPPLPREPVDEALLEREQELLGWLRAAFFLVNFGQLPAHFRRFAVETGSYDEEAGHRLDLETARSDYLEVERLLIELYEEMSTLAPEYAARRRDPASTVNTIIAALGEHADQHPGASEGTLTAG